jgi:hypothetical protein
VGSGTAGLTTAASAIRGAAERAIAAFTVMTNGALHVATEGPELQTRVALPMSSVRHDEKGGCQEEQD